MNRLLPALFLLAGLLTGCGGHSSSSRAPASTSTAATASAAAQPGPGSVNVLSGVTPASPATSPSGASSPSASPGTASSPGPAASPSPAGSPNPFFPAASTPPANQAQLWGSIPPDPATGFDGTLYLVGERLVPGSVISVEVNGVWTKLLPATFYSSELLGVYVHLTVPADYTFTAVAPDGTLSTPLPFTVPAGSMQAVSGTAPPALHMVFPPSLDTNFAGTLWLMGDQFMPGSVALVSVAGLPALPMPLLYVNERTVGLVVVTPFAGDFSVQISNPTFLTSAPVTVTVGQAAAPSALATPTFAAPAAVTSPFVGTVHLSGSDLLPGAVAELREAGGATVSLTPLIYVNSQEAWWTLAYPSQGTYEVRVVNPGGQAAPWASFRVD